MAQLLRVSGIAVPVLDGSVDETPKQAGDNERAEDFSLIVNRRAIKETYKIKIAPQSPSDGVAWRGLLLGLGHTWNFDSSFYSSKGLGPSALTNVVQNATAKFGAGGAQQTLSTGTFTFTALPLGGSKWTVMVWRKLGAGSFNHYIVTSASKALGHAYVNGSDTADATSWLTVNTAAGTVKLDADASNTTNLDDLVILPFDVPSAWPADVFAYGAAFSQLPYLDVDGDLIDGNVGLKTVCGDVSGTEIVQGVLNGTYYQAIRVLNAALEEV